MIGDSLEIKGMKVYRIDIAREYHYVQAVILTNQPATNIVMDIANKYPFLDVVLHSENEEMGPFCVSYNADGELSIYQSDHSA